ncbi:unnamed protein product [Caenorhabditis angaria]|uniref:RRM domain-containing protein n=1 Tax=Caenorhabditis angaria TaxID=860376 RepID=A0A9P1I9Y4_9PELO|nr:unnamed protein product [Caenorhabditis angaria]
MRFGTGPEGKSQQQSMFKALRRLHGQNLESRGLHDMTEAFQQFVTRARFFSIGKLRRTWSHSAAEFIKYRRLLPMLLADGEDFDAGETDDFDASIAFQAASRDNRKIVVSNISPRVTQSQLTSFFSNYGKITNCILPKEEKNSSVFGTLPKHRKNCGSATITFKTVDAADRARNATSEELKFYDQVMVVAGYVSKKRGGKGLVLADDFGGGSSREDTPLSRASSTQSLASGSINSEVFPIESLPLRILERVVSFLPISETIRMERVSKKYMEVSIKSWQTINRIVLARETLFNKSRPMRTSHLKQILARSGINLKSLDISGIHQLFDDKALKVIANCCPNLVELDISGIHANCEELEELGESLSKLEQLSYRGMETTGDKAFYFLFKSEISKKLKFIDLRNSKRLHGRAFRLFGSQLESLYLDGCSKVDNLALEDLCTNSAGLKELRINEVYRISDENLSMIARRMEDLSIFTLCGDSYKSLTKAGLIHISHMRNITELALDYNILVNDELLIAISAGLQKLQSLSLANAGDDSSITSEGLSAIKNLSELSQLDVSSLAALNSEVVKKLAELKKLELIQMRNCTYLADEGFSALIGLGSLKHVDLSGAILISNDSIQRFIKGFPSGPKLSPITLVVGGTAADASKLTVRGSRVVVDFSDYSAILQTSMQTSQSSSNQKGGFRITSASDNEASSDDEFEALTAQRSFYIDAVCGEDDSPITDDGKLAEWAEKEARSLGLLK